MRLVLSNGAGSQGISARTSRKSRQLAMIVSSAVNLLDSKGVSIPDQGCRQANVEGLFVSSWLRHDGRWVIDIWPTGQRKVMSLEFPRPVSCDAKASTIRIISWKRGTWEADLLRLAPPPLGFVVPFIPTSA